MLVLKGLVGLHRTTQFSFSGIRSWGIGFDYCDNELFGLEMNRDHSAVFETASKYYVSNSFVDYDGYSIYSKGFLPTVIDIIITITSDN